MSSLVSIEKVIVTHHGPIINNLVYYDGAEEQPLALRRISLDVDITATMLPYTMPKAGNCREFHEVLRDWTASLSAEIYLQIEPNNTKSRPFLTQNLRLLMRNYSRFGVKADEFVAGNIKTRFLQGTERTLAAKHQVNVTGWE